MFAWLLSLLTAVDWQVVSGWMYQFILITSGKLWPPPEDFVADTQRYYKGSLIVLVLFYTSLWSVKISFLIFFKCLGHNIRRQKIHWWSVFALTVATYLVCFGDTQYWCLVAPLKDIFAHCSSDSAIHWTLFTLKFNCAMDVLTDILSKSIAYGFSNF